MIEQLQVALTYWYIEANLRKFWGYVFVILIHKAQCMLVEGFKGSIVPPLTQISIFVIQTTCSRSSKNS